MTTPKRLVIVGAGFAGMAVYRNLPKKFKNNHHITLIDERNHFLFTPLLHEVATGSLESHHIVEPLRGLLDTNTHFIQSRVSHVDTAKKCVVVEGQDLPYDILVSAIGSTTNFFGTPGAQEHAYTLKSLDDATRLRRRFIDCFERAVYEDNPETKSSLLNFVIVGGGPTGVELAAEAAELFFETFAKYYADDYDFSDVRLTLVNAGETVLKTYIPKFQGHALKSLLAHRVTVRNAIRVKEVTETGVLTETGEQISAGTVVWTAGILPNEMNCLSEGFEINRGCIVVDETLRAHGLDSVFVLGDMALAPGNDGRGYPKTAQVAKQQGITTARNIVRLIEEKPLQAFRYREKGMLASLGSYDAVAQIGPFSFTGVFAWFVWRTIYLVNFNSWKKRFKIMLDWTVNLFSPRDITRT